MEELWRNIHEPVQNYAGRMLGAALIVLVGWLANRFLVGPLRRLLGRSRLDPSVASFLANSARTAILVVILLAVLNQFGVQTASLLTMLGAAGLAVALSLQNSLTNFASGLLLLSFRMIRVGDVIEVGDVRGRVSDMLPFHVVLVTSDNQRITVPNTLMTTGPVRNNSALPTRRVQWVLPVATALDLEAVKTAFRTRLVADSRILREPAPVFYVQDWTEDRRLLAIAAWTATNDQTIVQQEALEGLGQALEELRSQRAPSAG